MERAGAGADGEDGWEDCVEDGASNGETGSGKGFFEFYPFLNDAALNEMDGEARQETYCCIGSLAYLAVLLSDLVRMKMPP